MRYCDTFCGIGGFTQALKRVVGESAELVWAIDFDKNVSKTFKDNYGIDPLGNIREADKALVPEHDILFGGFPCQPFSRNGKWYNDGKVVGDSETRDNLFLELVKILDLKKPKYFVFENVKGLLSMRNGDGTLYLDTILSSLKSVGYKVNYKVLNSSDFGLPQQRKRVFFVGIRNDIDQEFEFPKPIKLEKCIKDILEDSTPEKLSIANYWKNRKLTIQRPDKKNHSFNKGDRRLDAILEIYRNSIKPSSPTKKIESVAILYGETPSGLPRQQDKIYSIYGISPTIATFSTPVIDDPNGFRVLSPRECARLQGFPDSFKLNSNKIVAYKQVGNSVSINVVEAILRELLKKKNP